MEFYDSIITTPTIKAAKATLLLHPCHISFPAPVETGLESDLKVDAFNPVSLILFGLLYLVMGYNHL